MPSPPDDVTYANALADSAAKAAAISTLQATPVFLSIPTDQSPLASLHDVALLQDQAPEPEKCSWRLAGCLLHPDHLWRSPDSRLVAPMILLPHFAHIHHGMAHVSKGRMIEAVKLDWFAPTFPSVAQQYCFACPLCQAHHVEKSV